MNSPYDLSAQLTPWCDAGLGGWTRPGAHSAPAVHLLHGNGFCASTLWPAAQLLPSDWNLLFTDVPGHGGSAQPDHKMPDWQAAVIQPSCVAGPGVVFTGNSVVSATGA